MAKGVEVYPCAPFTVRDKGMQISGDSRTNRFVYCNDLAVVICNLDNPGDVFVYEGHTQQTTVARFSPDGSWVASADIYGFLQIWNHNGDAHPRFNNLFPVIRCGIGELQWSPNGQALVACGYGFHSYVRVFFWESGETIVRLKGHIGPVLSCAFKPDLPFFLVTGGIDCLVNIHATKCLLDIHKGIPIEIQRTQRGHSGSVNCISYSSDGCKFISVGSDRKGIVYDGNNGDILGELCCQDMHTGNILSVSWSCDNKYVLTVSADNSAKVWEIDDHTGAGRLKKTLIVPGSDGKYDMLVGCLWMNDKLVVVSLGGMISIFSANNLDKPPLSFSGHMTGVTALSCFSLHGKKIILSSSNDGTIIKWIQGVGYGGHITRKDKTQIKCFAAVEKTVMVSGNDNMVKRIHLNDINDCKYEEVIEVASLPVDLSIAVQSHDRSLITTESEVIILKGAKVFSTTSLGFSATASTIAPDGNEVIVGDKNGCLHIYSVNGGHILSAWPPLKKHGGPITVVKYSPNGEFFTSADTLHEAIVWKSSSREAIMINLLYHMSIITCVAWSPNSRRVATGSLDRHVIVYAVGKRPSKRITITKAHVEGVYGLVFTDNDTLASSGKDGCVRLWKITTE